MAIPYTKQTWTDGSGGGTPVSAARLGVVEQGILDVSLAPAVRVFHNAAQSVTSGTPLALGFNSERFDQAGGASAAHHDTVTNNSRLTCLYTGVYLISGNIEWPSNTTGYRSLTIRHQGTTNIAATIETAPSVGSVIQLQNISTVYALAVNEYVELVADQLSGVGLNVNSTGNRSPEFMMVRVA